MMTRLIRLICLGWVMTAAAIGLTVAAVEETTSPAVTNVTPAPLTRIPPGSRVAIIKIEGNIYDFTYESLQRRVDRALERGADVIVIELDTNGGLVGAAVEISRYLKRLDVPTVAWITSKAYSAGLIIAAACDMIVMSDVTVTGDAAPISLMGDLSPTERAKAESPILLDFYDSADRNGHSYPVLKATCVLNVEVYRVKHNTTEREKLVNQADYQMMVQGLSRDEAMKAVTPVDGRAPVIIEEAKDEDIGQWTLVKQIHDGRTLLTVNEKQALEIGLSQATVSTQADLAQWLGTTKFIRVNESWSEVLASWLVHPIVRGILIVLFLVGFYLEAQAPGLGLPGAVAGVCLLLLLGAPFIVDLSKVWHIIVFFVGMALLIAEIYITPGFGVLGITGIVCMLTALILGPIPTGERFLPPREVHPQLVQYAVLSLLAVAVAVGCIGAIIHYFGHSPLLNRFILRERQLAGVGSLAGGQVSGSEVIGAGKIRTGDTGQVIAPLRPTGRVDILGEIIDASSPGEWVDAGTQVRVVEVRGNYVVVEPV